MNFYTLGLVFCGVGRGCDPMRLMSYAFLYTTTYRHTHTRD